MESYFASYGDLGMPSGTKPLSHCKSEFSAALLSQQWRRCSLSSDFWAKYVSEFYSRTPGPGFLARADIEAASSYLLNELFENCAKFSKGPVLDMVYETWIYEDFALHRMCNHILPSQVDRFVKLVRELLENDPEELYFKKLEANAETGNKESGLGYLTLMKDYGVRFGFGFFQASAESVRVDVHARLSAKEI